MALRWIFPLAARAAVDFFGTDTVDFFEPEVFLDEIFELVEFFVDDARDVEDRDEEERPFCATEPMGSNRRAASRIRQVRVRIRDSFPGTRRIDYR
jgi:hypothetical protein